MSSARANDGPIRLVIVDSQDVVRAGIESWLTGARPPIEVVDKVNDPPTFMARYPRATSEVDVVVCALLFNGRGPELAAPREMCAAGHRVVVYSSVASDELILSSLDAGATSFVGKFESAEHLCNAIYAASSGTPYVPPRMAEALQTETTVGRPRLTQREIEVLKAWFQTENKELVAQTLFVEPSTVRTHLQRIRAKYAAAGRPAPTKAALVARALQDGIIAVDEL